MSHIHSVDLPCDWVELLEACLGDTTTGHDQQVIITVISDQGFALPYEPQVADMRTMLEDCGVDVLDALCVKQDKFWSYLCQDTSCCPTEGNPINTTEDHQPSPEFTVDVASHGADDDLSVQADTAKAALFNLLDPELATVENANTLNTLMQNILIRDYIMVLIVQAGDDELPLARGLAAIAHSLPEGLRERIAATAAMSLVAAGEPKHHVTPLLDISGDQTLGTLVRRAINADVPSRVARDSLLDVTHICMEAVHHTVPMLG
ncbi:unannotated protein [freshwater metagenome]|uniref:Unannotated protein n=1 Tax=freshwater metagenome TaxID=449393 RepID=A0A6J5ZM60_9ZZZZ